MANLIKFESVRTIEKNREDVREARTKIIESAKDKYEKEERRKEQAKRRGEDTWMLLSISNRVDAEEESLKKSKRKRKKDKHKKSKEKKKRKKKKRESSSSPDSSSDSSSEEDDKPQWVEKGDKKRDSKEENLKGAVKGPKMERDSWMNAPLDLVPTVSRQDLINKKNEEKKEIEEQKRLLEQPGRHAKELNPYWKDGGTGLPDEKPPGSKPVTVGPGDSGLSWLRKSYQRCVEQAKEEGRNLEELAAERWGSLEKIQTMIAEAENITGVSSRSDRPGDRRSRFMRPGEGDQPGSSRDRSRFMRPGEGDQPGSSRDRSRNSPSRHSQSSSRHRSKSKERSYDHRKGSRSSSRDRYKRSYSKEKEHRKRSRSRDRKQRSRSRSKERSRRERSRSGERNRYRRSRSRERGSTSSRGRFMKPGEMSGQDGDSIYRAGKSSSSSGGVPAWKKREFQKPVEKESRESHSKTEENRGEERKKREQRRKHASSSSSSSASSSSDSESSSNDSESEKGQSSRSQEPKVTQKILSEKEMNALGAKILKAEIMGNTEQAEKLKAQLEGAREARKNLPAGGGGPEKKGGDDDDEFVVLTRTDRSGMARPVPDSKHGRESQSGKRRKKQNVETHEGKQGERVRYFADDDKFDLKTLVEREKMGTAEDQNSMFARLAGRAQKTQGDDFQVDDIFLSKANRKQAESVEEERDRARAIMEHKQTASAMEKCHFCFNKVEKHLIVAIGTKVYLCLPSTKSLTEGHCLIVPMQHVSSGTTVDEDVWSEIQLFRKTLTKMFKDRDEDAVFMELSMKLKYFPHMYVECVPIEKEVGDMAPIYFKKAIQDTGSEWAENKKVVDISKKDIRHAVPKGFPYFSVDFGNEGGFAHVIEDERTFPTYFGKEIIGGMIDADHSLWRKPHKENFDHQRKKVLQFAEMWKPYDWTQNLSKKTQIESSSSSDSDSD